MKRYVLDTNLYIRADRDEDWAEEMTRFVAAFLPSLYLHGVVAQEILAGAIDAKREKLIQDSLITPFARRRRLVTPTFGAWKRAGSIMAHLIQRKVMRPGAFGRSFANDCLLAASCRMQGMALITNNLNDFALIRRVEDLEVLEPWPP